MQIVADAKSVGSEGLSALTEELGIDLDALRSLVRIRGEPQQLQSPLKIIEAGTLAIAAQAVSIASLHLLRSGEHADIDIDCRDAVFALKPFPYLRLKGQRTEKWAQQIGAAPCSGHFPSQGGRYVYMANVGAKLREATLRFLGCEAERSSVLAAIARWDAEALEREMTAQGIPVAVVRSESEWHAMPHGIALATSPLFPSRCLAPSAPVPLPRSRRPFAGVRVVDMTHVVAGPYITRTLAEYGADVLYLSSARPALQDPSVVTDELQLGKRTARLELSSVADRTVLTQLLRDSDLFVHSWRPGVLERFGFTPEYITSLNPKIIQLSVSCYGSPGPWSRRAGFDGVALASIGATDAEARCDRPKISPPGVLTDALVGFLGCAVAAALLLKRAVQGGAYQAELSLARTGMWLLSLGQHSCPRSTSAELGEPKLIRRHSAIGIVDHVAPPISFSDIESILPSGGPSGHFWLS